MTSSKEVGNSKHDILITAELHMYIIYILFVFCLLFFLFSYITNRANNKKHIDADCTATKHVSYIVNKNNSKIYF